MIYGKYEGGAVGTRLALASVMSSRRVHPAAVAAASDGSVLINMAALLPTTVLERLGKQLGGEVFVGVALTQKDASAVVARLDDAAAEASAHLLGALPTKRGNRGRPKANTGAGRAQRTPTGNRR